METVEEITFYEYLQNTMVTSRAIYQAARNVALRNFGCSLDDDELDAVVAASALLCAIKVHPGADLLICMMHNNIMQDELWQYAFDRDGNKFTDVDGFYNNFKIPTDAIERAIDSINRIGVSISLADLALPPFQGMVQ